MKGKRLMKTIGFDEAESKEEGSTSNGLQTSSGEVHGNRSRSPSSESAAFLKRFFICHQ